MLHSKFLTFGILWLSLGTVTAAAAEPVKLLLTFSSYRERPKHPQIYFYEHDGLGEGKLAGSIPTVNLRSDNHASLSRDGRLVAFASEMENEVSKIAVWDRTEKKLLELKALNESPHAQLWPTLSGDGKSLYFTAWNRPGATLRWDLFRFDLGVQQLSALAEANTPAADERMPAVSADGRWLAFVTNAKEGAGAMDLALVDLKSGALTPLRNVNSEHREVEPSLSHDGRLVAFSSDRPGGAGGRDIYVFDRETQRYLDLPGLNAVAADQTPSLSPDGRFLAFVSERIAGEGERDIYLYDLTQKKLLATPHLNARQEDIDPCVIVLP